MAAIPNHRRLFAGVGAIALMACPAVALAGDRLSCSLERYSAAGPVQATLGAEQLDLSWHGAPGQALTLRLGISSGVPVIERLAINGQTIAENARVEFKVVTGMRRMTNQQMQPLKELGVAITDQEIDDHRWDAFWDAPLDMRAPTARRPGAQGPGGGGNLPPAEGVASQPGLPRKASEITRATATYGADGCVVTTQGARLTVSFPKMTASVFSGDLVLTVYAGSNLIRAEYAATTDAPAVAYKYDAGLTGLATGNSARVSWRDTANFMQDYRLQGGVNADAVPVFAANRLVVGETGAGAIAAFPPPHTFFWAREHEDNPGNNWYRKDTPTTFSIGVRQPEQETVEEYLANWALYSAPPGSRQRMAFYLYPALGDRKAALDGALAFTNNDRYPALAGFKVMGNHYHTNLGERLLEAGSLDARLPDFEVLRSAGIDIAGITDRPRDRPNGPSRLEVMNAMYEGAARQSDDQFMVMPNLENGRFLGGHWDVLVSRPTYWTEGVKDAPFKRSHPKLGTVYNVNDAAETLRMIEEQNMLVYMPHPRTKGSTHYPDAVKGEPHFNNDRYRGVGWRWGMGSDLSEARLSEKRVLPLFDEMNNWVARKPLRPKYVLAITETYRKGPGDDIYANGPVNYLRIPSLPTGGDYAPIIKALNDGDYFVSSGEVLIPSTSVSGAGRSAVLTADVRWTFPLDFVEVVWGDGEKTGGKIIDAKDLPPFGSKAFAVPFDSRGARWVRFAAWDSAGNGAMSQPISIGRK